MRLARLLLIVALVTPAVAAAAGPAEEYTELEEKFGKVDHERRLQREALEVWAEMLPAKDHPKLAAARKAVREAEQALEQAKAADKELGEAIDALRAAQAARDAKIRVLLSDAETYADARARYEALEKRVGELEAKMPGLSAEQLAELAEARLERNHLGGALYRARRAMWATTPIKPLYQKADRLYKQAGRERKKSEEYRKASGTLKQARKALKQAEAAAVAASPLTEAVRKKIAALDAEAKTLKDKMSALRREALGAKDWQWSVPVPLPPRKGKERKPSEALLWIPPGVETVRGLILGHPPALGARLTRDTHVRLAAAEKGLGVVLFKQFDAVFTYTKSGDRWDKVIADLAEASGHAELTRAAYLTIGHSTSGIFARNVAYWRPERSIGVVHVKSGNLHQHRPNPELELTGVPFVAINGEFEEFGPEGGIRPEYGGQTQWVMIREQLLRRRRQDPRRLMNLLVHPGGGHGGWQRELSRYLGLWIRKAADARLPETLPDDGPIRCVTVKPASGWLTDADIKTPDHKPAPYDEYTGKKSEAFWHFGKADAMATWNYHADAFILPDPAEESPVPKSWP